MIRYALSLVIRRKLRTLLTSLGVTISVILLSFIIFGMQDIQEVFVSEFTSRFKPNELIVSKVSFDFLGMGGDKTVEDEVKEEVVITPDLLDEILDHEDVENVNAAVMINGMQIALEDQNIAFDPAFVFGWDVSGTDTHFLSFEGEEETPQDGEALIANTVIDYYGIESSDAIGKMVTIKTSPSSFLSGKSKSSLDKTYEYKVIGVVDTGQDRSDLILSKEEGVNILVDMGGFSDSDDFLDSIGYDQVFITVYDEEKVEDVKQYLTEEKNLTVFTPEDLLSFLDLIINGLTLFLVVFSLISAIVASIGIINTMVMSIYEQTREIGIIKAIGAKDSQVLAIFLIQSAVIGFIGGVLGLIMVILGMTVSDPKIIELLQDAGFSAETFFTFNWEIALYIVIGSIIVGVLAGIYPAIKAAKLDPVRALRYE